MGTTYRSVRSRILSENFPVPLRLLHLLDKMHIQGRQNNRTKAFTLVELLVVIAIIGVLVGLHLPAVQSARAAARRISCYNNLKQLGVAFHNYESAHRRLPAGYIYKVGPQGNHAGFGWASMLLPFMEQTSVYNQLNFRAPLFDNANLVAREHHLSSYICPEDRVSPSGFVEMGSEKYAMASYVASFGPPDLDDTQEKREGLFSRNSGTRMADITDGLPNTLACGERENGPFRLSGVHGPHFSYETAWSGAIRELTDPTDDHGHMALFQTGHTPNNPFSDDRDVSAPHVGYANFLFADGAVTLLTEQIDSVSISTFPHEPVARSQCCLTSLSKRGRACFVEL